VTIDLTVIMRRFHGPIPLEGSASAAGPNMDRWGDTLARLACSHRVRLLAADPSRPWLTDNVERTVVARLHHGDPDRRQDQFD